MTEDQTAAAVETVAEQTVAPVENVAPDSQPESSPEVEKQVPQSEVNRIVASQKREAAEKANERGYQRAQDEFLARQQAQAQEPVQSQPEAMPQGDINSQVSAAFNAKLQEWNQQVELQQQQVELQQIGMKLSGQVNAARLKYENYDGIVKDSEVIDMPGVAKMASEFETGADILYTLAQSPKEAQSLSDLWARRPNVAMREVAKLADSIRNNESAKNIRLPNEPLSQAKPSQNAVEGGKSIHDMSIEEMRAGIFKQ